MLQNNPPIPTPHKKKGGGEGLKILTGHLTLTDYDLTLEVCGAKKKHGITIHNQPKLKRSKMLPDHEKQIFTKQLKCIQTSHQWQTAAIPRLSMNWSVNEVGWGGVGWREMADDHYNFFFKLWYIYTPTLKHVWMYSLYELKQCFTNNVFIMSIRNGIKRKEAYILKPHFSRLLLNDACYRKGHL